MITVITACFNSEKTIARAIESLLKQTDKDFEHIVIDGKSADKTVEIVESYKDKYRECNIPILIKSEKDEGLYDALNKGIALAKGDYIGIMNSDDWYEENTIEIVNKTALTGNYDVIMGASYTINGNQILKRKPGEGKFITSRNFNHGAMFVKADCYRELGGYENDGNYYDDFLWYIKALKHHKKFKIIDDVLYDFSCGGMSTKKSFKEMFKRINYRYAAYRKNDCSRLYIFECIAMEFAKWLLAKQ